jgi:hypothetical protein
MPGRASDGLSGRTVGYHEKRQDISSQSTTDRLPLKADGVDSG